MQCASRFWVPFFPTYDALLQQRFQLVVCTLHTCTRCRRACTIILISPWKAKKNYYNRKVVCLGWNFLNGKIIRWPPIQRECCGSENSEWLESERLAKSKMRARQKGASLIELNAGICELKNAYECISKFVIHMCRKNGQQRRERGKATTSFGC